MGADSAGKLSEALLLILDQVDYVRGNCSVTDMVGAVLPKEIIKIARDALREYLGKNILEVRDGR